MLHKLSIILVYLFRCICTYELQHQNLLRIDICSLLLFFSTRLLIEIDLEIERNRSNKLIEKKNNNELEFESLIVTP